MAFWSKERLESEQAKHPLVEPFLSGHIQQSAYALGVASEFAITSGGGGKQIAPPGEYITIPAGQFALLLTTEKVFVPINAIAFISMKAKFKLRGLINVSGFHVDPGFIGRLKFSVYNAGSSSIDLEPGQRLFLIWFSDLDRPTAAGYSGPHQGQDGISAEDVMSIRGIVASPAGIASRVDEVQETLRSEISRLENKITEHQNWSRPVLTAILVAVAMMLLGTFAQPLLQNLYKSVLGAPQTSVQGSQTPTSGGTPTPKP